MDKSLNLIQEAQTQVSSLLSDKLSKNIKFHTLTHTQEVVAGCQTMADYYKLNEEDRFALILAAWFHDTGYTGGESAGHEDRSIVIANQFISSHAIAENIKTKVVGCINATRLPQSPENLIEQIICDADLFHLGTGAFEEKSKLLRRELIDFGDNDLSKKAWRKINVRFLQRHEYFTDYAKTNLEPEKQKHLAALMEKEEDEQPEAAEKKDKGKEKEKDRDKEKGKIKTKKDPQAILAAEKAKKQKKPKEESAPYSALWHKIKIT
jgi:predicted metal-dependent HD superfamily phosphohydrolase